ncbi:hypothetical protein K461DRAFT_272745 [Myriangium duriaei CBS 260.36]|uniref:Defect at low temperature protein 1 n=1 Tax=Myriangium duriaei CBS 260.36 TaxID=1168546 RepID=A0A9P4J7B0_9PEZI|nr:hypothetical protein K461DRAFT_272745 [Myriangium duriaei CBS 260.36]
MARFHVPFFRIFYSTTYTSLYIIQLILLAITPASLIYSSIKANAFQYIFIVGGVYVLTALLVIFIYSSRLYTNRTVLAAVGKSWIPVEEDEVSKGVRKLVKGHLDRSAVVAFECKPRNLAEDGLLVRLSHQRTVSSDQTPAEARMIGRLVKVNPHFPAWGLVQHPGWSSPNPQETVLSPQIHFMQVIDELPNLLEARVVSLGGEPRISQEAARPMEEKLQNVPMVGLREYLGDLDSSGRIVVPGCAEEFVERYERARFCGRPLSENDFVALTSIFAELLSSIQPGQKNNSPPQQQVQRIIRRPGDRRSISSQESFSEAPRTTDTETVASVDLSSANPLRPRHVRIGSVLTPTWTAGTYSTRPSSSRRSSISSLQSAASVLYQSRGQRP